MARNKLDGREYAVKKVRFRHASPHVLLKVLREVKALANLQHPAIIGYNGAWLEYEKPHTLHLPSMRRYTFEESRFISNNSGSTFDSNIVFEEDDKHEVVEFQVNSYGFGPQDEILFGQCELSSDSCSSSEIPGEMGKVSSEENNNSVISYLSVSSSAVSEGRFASNPKEIEIQIERRHSLDKTQEMERKAGGRKLVFGQSVSCGHHSCSIADKDLHVNNQVEVDCLDEKFLPEMTVTLFIQMEICTYTLQEWMVNRNMSESHFNVDENMRIFQQMVQGVEYIHSQGLIHRDLKPRNIFLTGSDLHVKIGDFGLARENVTDNAGLDSDTILSPPADLNVFKEDNTHGVGTSTYAAPEQLIGSWYDNKCDMFSLGVVLFEIFQTFGTEMERHEKLKAFREESISVQFKQKWPEQAKAILSLTLQNPVLRPSATQILQSELFLSKDQLIQNLRKTINDQHAEIRQLKQLLNERDQEILALRQQKQ